MLERRERGAVEPDAHLGVEIVYVFDDVVRKYRPDFLVRLNTGIPLDRFLPMFTARNQES